MLTLRITRKKDNPNNTIGEFVLEKDGALLQKGFTLEPAGPDTVTPNQDRRIPEGTYKTIWYQSPKYKMKLANLYNDKVPVTRRILIHIGNYGEDTEGCILLGNSTNNTTMVGASRDAVVAFHKNTGQKEELRVIIANDIK